MSDDLVSKGLDRFISGLARSIEENEKDKVIVDENRLNDVMYSKSVLEQIVSGKKVKVTSKVHEPFNSVGSVSVVGEEVVVTDSEAFNKIAEVASNVEVYPKTNGTVVVTFTFHGLTKKE